MRGGYDLKVEVGGMLSGNGGKRGSNVQVDIVIESRTVEFDRVLCCRSQL